MKPPPITLPENHAALVRAQFWRLALGTWNLPAAPAVMGPCLRAKIAVAAITVFEVASDRSTNELPPALQRHSVAVQRGQTPNRGLGAHRFRAPLLRQNRPITKHTHFHL